MRPSFAEGDPGDSGRGPAALLFLSLGLLVWGGVVWQAGGFGIDVPWGRVSSRDPLRALGAGILCALILVRWKRPRGVADALRRVSSALETIAPFLAAAAALVAAWLGVRYGAHVAGGADPYGYLSQADLWLEGRLARDFSSLAPLPWSRPEWTLSPLGYRPGPWPYTIVPTYAPGLPLLMALFHLTLGAAAKFVVVPAAAALTVWSTYLLGKRWYDGAAGLVACSLLAASPAFLYQTMWPMSDVPAAAFWTMAILAACGGRRAAPILTGVAAGIALLIRPNLAPLAVVPLMLIAGHHAAGGRRNALVKAGVCVAAMLPAIAAVAALNTYWYGSPVRSGYGSFESLYSFGSFWPNLQRYSGWLIQTQTAFVLLAALPLVAPRVGPQGPHVRRTHLRAASALFLALLTVVYGFYLVFEEWWYLRFFLPAFPLLLVLATVGLRDLLFRLHAAAAPVAIVIAAPLVAWMVQTASNRTVFDLRQQEQGYVAVARDVSAAVPRDAVILAMQHSGSLRYYAARLTLRYDQLAPDRLDAVVRTLTSRGRPVYAVLEQWEEPAFVGRFAARSCRGALDWPAVESWTGIRRVRLYDLSSRRCRSGDGAAGAGPRP